MGIRALTRVGAGSYYDRYEREARAEAAGHAAPYDDEKDQCANTREENCGVGIKTHDNGSKNSCSKHGEHMLQAKENGLSPGSRSSGAMIPPVVGVQPVKYPCFSTVAIHSCLSKWSQTYRKGLTRGCAVV